MESPTETPNLGQPYIYGSGNEGKFLTYAGVACLILAVLLAGGVAFYNSQKRQTPIVFSNYQLLQETWNQYKIQNLEPGTGRTLDKQRKNVTTSEGEGYTMLRAVWQDDQKTFDTSWKWTKDNLHRPNDHLSSWLFGERPDGSYGVVTEQGGINNATDGDTDMAVALLFAASRWNRSDYLADSQAVIADIWKLDVVTIKDKPFLTADNLESQSLTDVVINPSYFAPYAYRMFAQVDRTHDWLGVIDSSYALLDQSLTLPVPSGPVVGLVPDWLVINKTTGKLSAPASPLTDNSGYDAMRVPWRLALDSLWYQEPRARQTLMHFSFLATEWNAHKSLSSIYKRDGMVIGSEESPAMYGASMGYFLIVHPDLAKEIYESKLTPLYSPSKQGWTANLSYYDDNWAWFGISLYNQQLPNLFKAP